MKSIKKSYSDAPVWLLVMLVLLSLTGVGGCGGGSAGTGTGERALIIAGYVRDPEGAPVPEVTVTVLESGDSAVTDGDGAFRITTQLSGPRATLEVAGRNGSATTTIEVPAEGGVLTLTIKVNPLLNEIDAEKLEVHARIVGFCDAYFENRNPILQTTRILPGTKCVARVTVSAGSLRVAHVPIAVQYRGCRERDPWNTLAIGATLTGSNLGVGQVTFPFSDDRKHCLYRIVAPFEVEALPPISTEIVTFTYQAERGRKEK